MAILKVMSIYSEEFSHLYDSLMEGSDVLIHAVQVLVYEQTQGKRHVSLLELGCGTGTILQSFPPSFSLYGLDIAPGMLAIARKKVKRATFFKGDMSNFSLNKKFDVIISIFDSINHLLQFSQWESMCMHVSKHLKKDGVFVFDINTVKRHMALSQLPAYVKKEKDRIISIKIIQTGKNIFTARFEVFSDITAQKITFFEENIPEASFPTGKVIRVVKKYFTIEKLHDVYREKVTEETGRIFFVCKKKKKQPPPTRQ